MVDTANPNAHEDISSPLDDRMDLRSLRGVVLTGLCCAYVTAVLWNFFRPIEQMAIIPFHVYVTVAIVLLAKPMHSSAWFAGSTIPPRLLDVLDWIMVATCLALCAHYASEAIRLQTRMQYIDEVFFTDKLAFFAGTIVLLEAVRRQVGLVLLILLVVFLFYAFFGNWFPGALSFSGFSVDEATDILSMQTNGIFDVPAQVGLNVITFFVVFGAIFTMTGGGAVFIDLAFRITGRMVGGAAKSAVIGSAMFGTVSGSAVANVTTTGVLTIPLMRRGGLTPEQAAATEAISSSGGQLMPPIMGTAAFVMAQILGRPYIEVAMAGLIPAIGFYFALFMTIDLRARKLGALKRVEREVPPLGPRLHLLAGPISLIIALFAGYSANYAAIIGIAVALAAPFLRAHTRPALKDLAWMMPISGRQAAEIAVACTSVGIVMAIAIQSSLVLKFVGVLSQLGDGNLFLSLVLIIFGCIIMGMGMPTVAAYIVGSVLFVPALTALDVPTLSAHYFILYYCVLSMVTPPVALTAYAAAGLSGGNILKTGMLAFFYGLVMFVIPFGFIRDEAILGQAGTMSVAVAFIGMIIATFSWSVFLQNWLGRVLWLPERIAFGALSFAIIIQPSDSVLWFALCAGLVGLMGWCLFSRGLRAKPVPVTQGD
ncbi:TRAP transporter 4TM/12TM fusion protein [Aliiruegeria haliotis]|uniref:TRAP transporter 4TM/12TM fusion protein n=1 Tax=Aliiruegeria haliotis TaxID=1280846 RepID=A0A2T0RFY0_9RHOB|nr:TRAP transporter fused permease subunit [Aliiruegeria haliotis]PRY20078.1 TRAP transporter 4TM/12TM fusion protein [Aliiruegeria haliotis]